MELDGNLFFKSEVTVIPKLLYKYFGKYYNNSLCNIGLWMFFSWYILHFLFDHLLHSLLKKMKFKEYTRTRLVRSLWYLGFYGTALFYCIATLIQNDLPLFKIQDPFDSSNALLSHLILGLIIVLSFYVHSAFWERLKYGYGLLGLTYLCLFFFVCCGYFLRFIGGSFRLTILIGITQSTLEIARCVSVLITTDTLIGKMLTGTFLALCVSTFIVNYLVVIPTLFAYPIIKHNISPSVGIWLTFLMVWLINEIYESVLWKGICHCFRLTKNENNCTNAIIECALFPPRDDIVHNLIIFRNEMIEREEKCVSLRKPKSKNMVFQTLKCMVAIKRKLNEKRHTTHSPNEESMEKLNTDKEQESVFKVNSSYSTADSDVTTVNTGEKINSTDDSKNDKDFKYKVE